LVMVFMRGVNMFLRRSDNYDEFIWPAAPTNNAQLSTANNAKSIVDVSGIDLDFLCAGELCCNVGTVWTDTSGCIVDKNYHPPKK